MFASYRSLLRRGFPGASAPTSAPAALLACALTLLFLAPLTARAQDAAPPVGAPSPADRPFMTLGELARELSNDPAAFDDLLNRVGGGGTAVGNLSAEDRTKLRALFNSQDFAALDRQPLTNLDNLALGIDGLGARRGRPEAAPPANGSGTSPVTPAVEALGIPTNTPPLTGEPFLQPMGHGMMHGDHLDPDKARRYGDSKRLADVMERLALNQPGEPAFKVTYNGGTYTTTDGLIRALQRSGHTVVVEDQRYLANFGDLEKDGRAVATPVWADTGRRDAAGNPVVIPVPHAHLAVTVRGPEVNGDVTLFSGLDVAGNGGGGMHFRADASADAPWVGGKVANTYTGKDAVKAVRLMGLLRRSADEKVREHRLPLEGYHALGVCTMTPALVEKALRGKTTIWPLTHNTALFTGDGEIDRLVRSLPTDGHGSPPPSNERILGSIPWAKTDDIPFPSLRTAVANLPNAPATVGAGQTGDGGPPREGVIDRLNGDGGQRPNQAGGGR
ncbi:MAG: hypothetical protein HZA54_14515 [Planctomycetes bacterium]|nr:hypothetical protein [Planctomycetota bacterium]